MMLSLPVCNGLWIRLPCSTVQRKRGCTWRTSPSKFASMAFGVCTNKKQFSTLYRSKMENFCKIFFDIVTTYNDEICYVQHVLDPLCVFFNLFGCEGGGTKGCRAHNLIVQFSGLGSSKWNFSEIDFFHTLTIQNDQISYVKHVLAPLPSSRCLAEGNRIFHACGRCGNGSTYSSMR